MMLDSYFEEVRKKRRKNLVFWLIVLFFSVILFFFFKGKYISVNLNWTQMFSSNNIAETKILTGATATGSQNPIFSVHSFGIVNVKVFPRDAEILLNGKNYSNDSKPQVDYGDYTLEINHRDYLTGAMDFRINDTKNFYIDDIILLKNPEYKKFPKISEPNIVSLGNNYFMNQTASGMILYRENFSTGTLVNKKNLTHIGGGKFLSGSTLVEFDTGNFTWSSDGFHPIVKNFVKTCENPTFKNNLYFCGENSAMTSKWLAFTGFVDSGRNFLRFEDKIFVWNIAENNYKNFSLTGVVLRDKNIWKNFLEIDGNWVYFENNPHPDFASGSLTVQGFDGKIFEKNPLEIELDSLETIVEFGDKNFFFGEKTGSGKVLAIAEKHRNEAEIQYLDFPEINLTDLRIYEKNNHFFIKTQNALLFLYKWSREIKWLVDGKILAIWADFALYEKEDGVWIVDWKDKNLVK